MRRTSALLGLLTCLLLCPGAYADAPRPHILIILADDFGWNDVGYHGSEIRTPTIDRLAASGARLDQYYVQPVCTPTRASLMTGRYPMRMGLQVGVIRAWDQHGLPAGERTLPEMLREADYTTALTGKWHLGHADEDHLPTRRGFDFQYGHYLGMIDYFTHSHFDGHDWHRQDQPLREEGYATRLIADEAVHRIMNHDREGPLFLYVAFNAPHTPLQVPPAYLEGYERIADERRRVLAAMMTCMDEEIGRILAALRRRDMADDTLVIFSSDNGGAVYAGASNGPLRAGKGSLYEGGVRVPAIAAWPGRIAPGTTIGEPIHIADWYPTLAKLAGASIGSSKDLDGYDISSVILEGSDTPREEILHNVTELSGALRRGRWKLVVNGNHRRSEEQNRTAPVVELFDIAADPYEQTNLADRHPEKVAELQRRLETYRRAAAPARRLPSRQRPEGWTPPEVWGPRAGRAGTFDAPAAASEGAASASEPASTGRGAARARPNVLLITADDLNYDSLGVTGSTTPDVTPNLDRLASESIRFVHAHVTVAICQPTRSVWMTGRYPHRNGAEGFEPINEDVPTLTETLRAAGYFNGILGKVNHLAPQDRFAWDVVVGGAELGAGRSPELYYQRSKQFFETARAAEKPFFLMANTHDPHRPFVGSQRDARAARRSGGDPQSTSSTRIYRPDEVEVPCFLPDLPEVRREIAEYYASVHRCDRSVGQLLKALEDSGLADDTLVMFLSDHGMALPFAKTNCYLTSTRTPWIIRWPGTVKPGTVDDRHMISGIDLMPTVLDALGIPPVEGMDGRSFLPLLRGESQEDRDRVFTMIFRTAGRNEYPMRSVQDRRFGYIFNAWSDGETVFRNESQTGRTMAAMRAAAETDEGVAARVRLFLYRVPEEFYDYQADPCALRNLIDNPEHDRKIDGFRRELLRWMEATGDPLLPTFRERLRDTARTR